MTLPIEWSDIFNAIFTRIGGMRPPWSTTGVLGTSPLTEDTYSVRNSLAFPDLTHLEFGKDITSVEFIEAILESCDARKGVDIRKLRQAHSQDR